MTTSNSNDMSHLSTVQIDGAETKEVSEDAKILLNFFCDKFGQKKNNLQIIESCDIPKIMDICFSDQYKVVWCDPVPGTDYFRCVYKERKEFNNRLIERKRKMDLPEEAEEVPTKSCPLEPNLQDFFPEQN